MSVPAFPTAQVCAQLADAGRLDEALKLYAKCLSASTDTQIVAQRCREYVQANGAVQQNNALRTHPYLRRAVFLRVIKQRVLHDATVETYFDVVSCFCEGNIHACIAYLRDAPRSIPLKLGRLLLYCCEFGTEMNAEKFRACVASFFCVPEISAAVITPQWLKQVSRQKPLAHQETDIVLKLADLFAPGSTLSSLLLLFPQLDPLELARVITITELGLEQLSQRMLDDPDFVANTLADSALNKQSRKQRVKYVKLDENEREARRERLREENKRNFVYEYVPLEEVDSDPEEEDTDVSTKTELSEADRKLAAQEELLWAEWSKNREVFDRNMRKSPLRAQLRTKLNWTDEQIEGWARFTGSKGRGGQAETLPAGMRQVESYGQTTERAPREKTKKSKPNAKPSSSKPSSSKPGSSKPGPKRESAQEKKEKAIKRDKREKREKRAQRNL